MKVLCRFLVVLFLLLGGHALPAQAADDLFPSYPVIQNNVAFWKKVYADHPSTKGFIHDNQNLAIIYETISLENDDCPEGVQANERIVKSAKEKYRQVLASLAQGQPPSTPDEKRVADLFGPAARPETFTAAMETIRFQRCLNDRFQAGVVRSGRYLAQIQEIFRQYGLPGDLAYLPHVESSFDYQAYSKSGAAGIWQLIRATGSRFLTINATVDERRDPIIATHAAAQFLRGNFQKLDSWPLALTAYNHGLTAMLRAKNSLGTYERIVQEYDGPRFGFASRNFYSEFLAAREVAKNYRHYFPALRLDEPVQNKSVTIDSPIAIKQVANHFKVDTATLASLNPALLPPVWEGRKPVPKGYRLRLPSSTADAERLAASLPNKPPPPPASPPVQANPARFHQVKKGDTLLSIAERYQVSAPELIAKNRLAKGAVLKVGQRLEIPSAATRQKPKARMAQQRS